MKEPKFSTNARIIAAAPELLEALKGLRSEAAKLAERLNADGNGHAGTAPIWAWLEDANDAIIHAEGK